jgi:hypothetical protein
MDQMTSKRNEGRTIIRMGATHNEVTMANGLTETLDLKPHLPKGAEIDQKIKAKRDEREDRHMLALTICSLHGIKDKGKRNAGPR